MPEAGFNVFLSHNARNKTVARMLKSALGARGVIAWLDEDELRPGVPWQQSLEDAIRNAASIAVLVGDDGIGPWENEEVQAALRLAVKDQRPVVPVLLPSAEDAIELPLFLANRTWVDLRAGIDNEVSLDRLVWGLTGEKGGTSASSPYSVNTVGPCGEHRPTAHHQHAEGHKLRADATRSSARLTANRPNQNATLDERNLRVQRQRFESVMLPRIRTWTQLIAFIFFLVSAVVTLTSSALLGLLGFLSAALALLCAFPLNRIATRVPTGLDIPSAEHGALYRFVIRWSVAAALLLFFSFALFSYMAFRTWLAADISHVRERAKADMLIEINQRRTASILSIAMELRKSPDIPGQLLANYELQKHVWNNYNAEFYEFVRALDQRAPGRELHGKYRRLRYQILRSTCCLEALRDANPNEFFCSAFDFTGRIPLEMSNQLKSWPMSGAAHESQWEYVERAECTSENLVRAARQLQGLLTTFALELGRLAGVGHNE